MKCSWYFTWINTLSGYWIPLIQQYKLGWLYVADHESMDHGSADHVIRMLSLTFDTAHWAEFIQLSTAMAYTMLFIIIAHPMYSKFAQNAEWQSLKENSQACLHSHLKHNSNKFK